MEETQKEKKVFESDMNDNDVIFYDYESSEDAANGRAHGQEDEKEKTSGGSTSNEKYS